MLLICGLGNPGKEYQQTRHNIGFLFIDYLLEELSIDSAELKNKFQADFIKTEYLEHEVIIAKPQTYMNNSGIAVAELCKFFKIKPEETIIIHDELDLPFNSIKTKLGGGHAGHNGLKDIDKRIGKKYHRIRVGIDHPRNIAGDFREVADYVLCKFSEEQQKQLEALNNKTINELDQIIKANF